MPRWAIGEPDAALAWWWSMTVGNLSRVSFMARPECRFLYVVPRSSLPKAICAPLRQTHTLGPFGHCGLCPLLLQPLMQDGRLCLGLTAPLDLFVEPLLQG